MPLIIIDNFYNILCLLQFFLFIFSVEKTSKELINNTLNLSQSFQINYYEKYSKCDKIKHINRDNELKIRK